MESITAYQVVDWDKNFEGAKSRTYSNKTTCQMPTKHGLGYKKLVKSKDGAAIFGAWCAMVQVLSRHPKPREGYCTDTGRIDGKPYTAEDLELLTDIPAKYFKSMIQVAASKHVGWLRIPDGYQADTTGPLHSDSDSDLDSNSDSDSGFKPRAPIKKSYGSEFGMVRLTEHEYERLIDKCGSEEMRQRVIDKLDIFLASKATKYKSHYAVILKWVIRAVKEESFQITTAPPGDPDFTAFWQAWPESKRKAELEARRAFAEATTKPPIDELIAEIELQKQSEEWQENGGKYIPSPVTWLRDGRWTDIVTVKNRR